MCSNRHKLYEFFLELKYMPVKRIVCLANSRKLLNRCVAGVELVNGGFGRWIRPVTARPAGEITYQEQMCTNGTASELLDILEIDFGADVPNGHQSENVLITVGRSWVKAGRLQSIDDLAPILHCGQEPLWPHTRSTKIGCNDEISANDLPCLESSLALIRPTNATVRVLHPFKAGGKLDVRVRFEWGGEQNDLMLTDVQKEAIYQDIGVGEYNLNNPTMCVSIGEIFELRRAAYKLVVGLMG